MAHIHKFIFFLFEENTYVIWDDRREAFIIDPGCKTGEEKDRLFAFIAEKELHINAILLTHGHLDHIFGVNDCVGRYACPVYMHPAETEVMEGFNGWILSGIRSEMPETFAFRPIKDGDTICAGELTATVIETPGHSLGGVCFLFGPEKIVFTGDTLFAGSIGRTDNRWASLDAIQASLREKLMTLDGDIDILPGHGGASSISKERMTNPFIYGNED